jgi:hypothetical protein
MLQVKGSRAKARGIIGLIMVRSSALLYFKQLICLSREICRGNSTSVAVHQFLEKQVWQLISICISQYISPTDIIVT